MSIDLEQRIFNIKNDAEFEDIALAIFNFQYKNVPVYRNYADKLGRTNPTKISEIPFLPISCFKTSKVISSSLEAKIVFKSSGTGGERSKHYVAKPSIYEKAFNQGYHDLIGNPKGQVILALLPNYVEQGESSLVYMVDSLINQSKNKLSGFLLNKLDEIQERYNEAITSGKQVVLIGVSYALLDLAEKSINLSKATIIETGGMKGRRKEMTKIELHQKLIEGLGVQQIRSEYGMTELLSQGYSEGELFQPSKTMKVLIREVNDPFNYLDAGKTGGINVIDLANIHSCSFIETQDLGQWIDNGFKIMGRFDNSDIRGCNLLVQ